MLHHDSSLTRMWARLVLFVLVLTVPAVSLGQDNRNRKKGEHRDRVEFDFSFDYDPAELRDISAKLRFKRIWGPFGIAGHHIFPAAESGPYQGPPQRIWSNGFATSLWRDPVTGWPLQ